MSEVTEQWDRLMSTLRQRGADKTVDTVAPPLPPEETAATLNRVDGLAVFVYDDISEWLLCHNGFRDGRWAQLFPDVDLLGVAQMAEAWQLMLQAHPAPSGYALYSGPPAYGFIRQYVPIAERDGYLWVADSRPGEHLHRVIAFDKVDADEDATTWSSIGSLLRAIADAVDNGTPFDGWTPSVDDGELIWTLD